MEPHTQNKQVITACAFIYKEIDGVRKVFIPKRAETKAFLPGVFELPGGHIEFGEEVVAGLKREIKEELDADILVGDPFYAFAYLNELKGTHAVEVVFFAKFANPDIDIVLNPKDHSEFVWLSENEIRIVGENKGFDNPEYLALQKGFGLLRNEAPAYA